jgi:hypothetical protein
LLPRIPKGEVYVPPQSISLRKVGKEKGGGNYHSTDNRFYIIRNEDKQWVWGYNQYTDSNGHLVSATNGDDRYYNTKTECVDEIERLLREEKYEALLWEN